jgi:2-polyprenyl-3-methyl-5-hydroxy-6-metoxy-1,4-benzoquinol methylase
MNDPFLNHKEPEEIFLPLSDKRYADFYAIEMDGFVQDIQFYKEHSTQGSSILELGCGTGRISRALASSGRSVVGLDLSYSMLNKATHCPGDSTLYVCMDMTKMAIQQKFDHILIPYNSLNLLRHNVSIAKCLQQTHDLLKPDGTLLLQIYIPDLQILQLNGQRLFQFQMFSLGNNRGKLIKETLRSYLSEKKEILLEERYRLRPVQKNVTREDLSHVLHLAGFSLEEWLDILRTNGFHKLSLFGDYDSRPFHPKTNALLLIQAHPSC